MHKAFKNPETWRWISLLFFGGGLYLLARCYATQNMVVMIAGIVLFLIDMFMRWFGPQSKDWP